MTNKPKVVLIEDHDALREATLEILRQEGFNVEGLSCAEDIDDAPLIDSPDIYIIDLNLPGEDGISLALRLRNSQPLAGIVMTTARSQLQDRITGYKTGADVYLPKPVDPQELIATLNNLVQRLQRQAQADRLQLMRDQLLLRGPESQSRLSKSEVLLLVALSRAKNQTLERWQLITQLDPNDADISADNLQNRLSQLRKKITACGVAGETIKAIRGAGYRLCVQISVV